MTTLTVIRGSCLTALLLLVASRPGLAVNPVFSNQTVGAGVSATHDTSGFTNSSYSGGGTVGDFNGDGWQDIYWPSGGDAGQRDKLWINNGNGTFTDEAVAWGLTDIHKGKGATVGDYDDDGDLDLYVTSAGPAAGQQVGYHKLYRNNGNNTFTNVAVAAGVNATVTSGNSDGWSGVFNDYDLDGDLDLFVSGSRSGNIGSRLFRNNGNGTFTDVTGISGAGGIDLFSGVSGVFGFSPRFVDTNGDNYPELLFVGDFGSSVYFKNNTDGTFTEWSSQSNTTHEENGMGATIGDYNNDGLVDWYASSIFFPSNNWTGNKLYLNLGGHTFSEISASAGTDDGGYGWGCVSVDFNHNGDQDILETNGASNGTFANEQTYLFMNNGNNTFTEKAVSSGLAHFENGRGMVNFDYDNDGDQDVMIFANHDPIHLFRNDLPVGSSTHWLRVFLNTQLDTDLAPHGIGARVKVTSGSLVRYRFMDGGTNFLSTSELSAHFGLGSNTNVDELRVDWPNGTVTILTNVAVDQTITISSTVVPETPGDMNCDGSVNLDDIEPFALALVDPVEYGIQHPLCNVANADLDGNSLQDGRDVSFFVEELLP